MDCQKRYSYIKWVILQECQEPILIAKKVEIELNLSNYAIKYDLENATGVDTSDFVKKKMIYLD